MSKSPAIEAIERYTGRKGVYVSNSLHTNIPTFREVVEYFKEIPSEGYKFHIHGDLFVCINIGDLDVFGATGVSKQVFQEKFLETDHEVEEFDVDYSTGTVYYVVGDVLEDGTPTCIEGEAGFWEVVEKCQN